VRALGDGFEQRVKACQAVSGSQVALDVDENEAKQQERPTDPIFTGVLNTDKDRIDD
jgi:hypothetical protein